MTAGPPIQRRVTIRPVRVSLEGGSVFALRVIVRSAMEGRVLQPGDQVPHFDVTDSRGQAVHYRAIWQRKNLVLVTLPDPPGAMTDYASQVDARIPALTALDAECVMTRDTVAGIPAPGVVVADRWGEIVHAASGSHVADLPRPDELLEWVAYVQRRCPECEGEAK
jgi:hypothetical protein